MLHLFLSLLPVAMGTDSRSFEEIFNSVEDGISELAHRSVHQQVMPQDSFLALLNGQIGDGELPSIKDETFLYEDTLGLAFSISLRHLLLHPAGDCALKHLKGTLRHLARLIESQYDLGETAAIVARAKLALLGLETVVSFPSNGRLSPAEVYAIMFQLAEFPPLLETFKVSKKEARALLTESLARSYENLPESRTGQEFFVLSGVQALKPITEVAPISVPADPEGIPLGPTTKMNFPCTFSEDADQAFSCLKFRIESQLNYIEMPSKEQRTFEREVRMQGREAFIASIESWNPFVDFEGSNIIFKEHVKQFFMMLNRLEMQATNALGRENVVKTVQAVIDEAERLYKRSRALNDREIALQSLSGLLNALKQGLSEKIWDHPALQAPLDYVEILSLFWSLADQPDKKRQLLEALSVLEKTKPQYMHSPSQSVLAELSFFTDSILMRISCAWSSLLPDFFPDLETHPKTALFRAHMGTVRRANMCRLSIKKDDLIKKIKLRAPERFCRAKELELPPLATDIYTKMSRIECIPLFLSEANMTGMSDLIQSSALDWIGEQFESSSEQSKETAMRALKGLQNLFKYSITEQVFSEKRVTHDPVLLLDYYRVAFAALSPRFGEANSKMLETYLKSLAAFHGEWTKDWEKGCPFAVADAFLEFLDGTLSYLSSYYCRPYYSPNEWAFAARLPWVDEPSRQSDIDKR